MTDDIGRGVHNYFDITIEETTELEDDCYLQKVYNKEQESYGLLYRENGRYSSPEQVSMDVSNERDVDQLILAAERNGIEQILEPQRPDKE
jgi:hypothetical protein